MSNDAKAIAWPRLDLYTPDAAVRGPSPDESALILALATYLRETRDQDDIRLAIGSWVHHIRQAGMQPEKLLIRFKRIMLGLTPAQQSADYYVLLEDRREMILMCIKEYFAESAGPS